VLHQCNKTSERGARACDTPLTRANHTSWARFISCSNIPRSLAVACLERSHIFHIPSARPLLHPIIYLVYPLKRKSCPGCPRHLLHGIFSMAFSSVSLSPSQRRLPSPRTGDVQRTVRRQELTYAPSNCGATRYWTECQD
jgi:hypothetical protein